MSLSAYLAHGGLGNYDELIFAGVAVIFVVMMGISWVRSRNIEPDFDDDEPTPKQKNDDASPDDSADHFRLD